MRHQFIRLLSGSIQTDRSIGHISFAERHFLIHTIHTAGAGIDQMFYMVMTTDFQNIKEPHQVAFCVCIGIDKGITHSRLCRQITYNVEVFRIKQRSQQVTVCDIAFHKTIVGI